MNPPGCQLPPDPAATERRPRRDGDTKPRQACRRATRFPLPSPEPRYGAGSGRRLRTRRAVMPAGPAAVAFPHVVRCREPKTHPGRVSPPEGARITTGTTTRRIRPPAKTASRGGFRRPRATPPIMVSFTVRLGARIEALLCRALPTPAAAGPDRAATAGGSCRCARPAGSRQTGAGPPRNTHPYRLLQRPVSWLHTDRSRIQMDFNLFFSFSNDGLKLKKI